MLCGWKVQEAQDDLLLQNTCLAMDIPRVISGVDIADVAPDCDRMCDGGEI